jgi:PiT family inorganic phosphate transporter
MDPTLILGIIIVILALAFAFSNGFNDAANAVATVISTRAISPTTGIIIAGICEFIGAYFLGTAVAQTIGKGIVNLELVSGSKYGIIVVFATIIGSTLWNILCTILGFPISASHSLIGGFIGAGIFGFGFDVINWANVAMIFFALIIAPLVGSLASFLLLKTTYFFFKNATTKINNFFRILEIIASMNFALSHGTNDGQKPMGLIVFSLIVLGLMKPSTGSFVVPKWVVLACSFFITLGVLIGGWNVIKTVGSRIFRIRHIHSFSALVSGAIVIYLASFIGLPLSTTHVISSTVMGAGAAERFKGVRWTTMKNIFIVWIITIPATAIFCGLLYILIFRILKFFGL